MKNERETNNNTVLIYETDGMCVEFEAIVTGSGTDPETGRDYVILDRTAFFPGGGGQLCDTGELTPDGGEAVDVTAVANVDGEILHYVAKPIETGRIVKGHLDEKKRYARMQNHGSEHLISGLIKSLYGFENVGFHMTDEEVVIDTGGPLTDEQLRIVEERANEAVFKNVPFVISFPTPEEAKEQSYRSKIDMYDNIRLVTVEGYDVCACCAPHVCSTGQLGVIKIVSAVPHRGGMRLIVTAGMDAYRDYVMLHDANAKIMDILSSPREKTAEFAQSFVDRAAEAKIETGELRKELAKIKTGAIVKELKEAKEPKPFEVLFVESLDPTGLRNLVNECTKVSKAKICAFTGDDKSGYRYIFAVDPDVSKEADLKGFLASFNGELDAQGGGSEIMVQGTCRSRRADIEKYFANLINRA